MADGPQPNRHEGLSPVTDLAMTIQEANARALDDLSDSARRIVIEGWPMSEWYPPLEIGQREPIPATELCSNDYLHGKGVCYGPGGDALCLACQVAWVERYAEPNWWVSIDVAA